MKKKNEYEYDKLLCELLDRINNLLASIDEYSVKGVRVKLQSIYAEFSDAREELQREES